MASNVSPTILLIPGAFTTPACYDLVLPYLKEAGYPVAISALPSSNSTSQDECTAASDGQYLLDQCLLPLIADGQDVMVFAHSFGATCLSGAGCKLSKAERSANGLPGGVVGLLYMSFAMAADGQSQIEYVGGAWPPFIRLDHVSPNCKITS